jgi:hypothetical protein
MLMTEEMFLVSVAFSIPVFWMFFKMSVNQSDLQPPQPTPEPALSAHQKQALDKTA